MTLTADICADAPGNHRSRPDGGARLLLSVVVPTFNERDNVSELVARIDRCLAGIAWEIMFVDDDSTDGTLDVLRDLSRSNARVRFIQRIGRRGLASAVVEGILATSSPVVAVMDCDLQHDEALLPEMLEQLITADYDAVVGSRYMAAASVGNWTKKRLFFSRVATALADFVLPSKLTDPMSGFFMIRRNAFDRAVRHLSNQGYKILLDIVLSARPRLRIKEIPYDFRTRLRGESKLDSIAILDYLGLLIDKTIGHVIPLRFFMFACVGGMGLIVHLATLAMLNRAAGIAFATANLGAATVAMMFNFQLNNQITYRDQRLRGPRLWRGLLLFLVVCSVGAVANVGIARVLYETHTYWTVAGAIGAVIGVVWNYAVSATLVWRAR